MTPALVNLFRPSAWTGILPIVFGGILLFFLGCSSEPVNSQQDPLLVVNDEVVSRQEFLDAFARSMHPGEQLSDVEKQELQRTFLVQLIDRKLIHAEADRLNVSVSPAEVERALAEYRKDYPEGGFQAMLNDRGLSLRDWQMELQDGLMMEKLLDQSVYAGLEVSDNEVAAYYEKHKEDFNRPDQVRARQIVVADEDEGQALLGQLRQGQDFAELAKAHSLSPDAQQGGDLGFFGRGEMPPEFDNVVFDLPVGRLSDLIKSEYGYHIFLVEEKRSAARLGKKEANEEIRNILLAQKREEVYQQWLQNLRAQATISVDWTQLETLEKH